MNPFVWIIPAVVMLVTLVVSIGRKRKTLVASVAALLADVYFFVLLAVVNSSLTQLNYSQLNDLTAEALPVSRNVLYFITGIAVPNEQQLEQVYPILRGMLLGCVGITLLMTVLGCIRLLRPPHHSDIE